jgi:hypothetical protein
LRRGLFFPRRAIHERRSRHIVIGGQGHDVFSKTDRLLLTHIIHECRREAFETEARRGFSQVRPTEAYLQSVEEAEREKPRRARGSDDVAGIHE